MSNKVTVSGERAKIVADLVRAASGQPAQPGDTVTVQVGSDGQPVQVTLK